MTFRTNMAGKRTRGFISRRLCFHLLSVVVWLAAVGAVVVLFHRRAERFEFLGVVRGRVYQAATNCGGRLREIRVGLFQAVEAGQPLVVVDTVLDNENLAALLQTARAEIEHLRLQLQATEARMNAEAVNLQNDWIVAQRRFALDVENARLAVLQQKAQLEADRITLAGIAAELEAAKDLVEQQAVARYEQEKWQAQYDALDKKIKEAEAVLKQATEDFLKAQDRRDEFAARHPAHPSVDKALAPIRAAITVQQRRVDEILARTEALLLTAPFDGVVASILHRPGDAVVAGDVILTVVEAQPRQLVAYVPEQHARRVRPDARVKLVRTGQPDQAAVSRVVSLGPQVEMMPQQLWANPNIPEWGRPVLIELPPGLNVVPGELVGVRLL